MLAAASHALALFVEFGTGVAVAVLLRTDQIQRNPFRLYGQALLDRSSVSWNPRNENGSIKTNEPLQLADGTALDLFIKRPLHLSRQQPVHSENTPYIGHQRRLHMRTQCRAYQQAPMQRLGIARTALPEARTYAVLGRGRGHRGMSIQHHGCRRVHCSWLLSAAVVNALSHDVGGAAGNYNVQNITRRNIAYT